MLKIKSVLQSIHTIPTLLQKSKLESFLQKFSLPKRCTSPHNHQPILWRNLLPKQFKIYIFTKLLNPHANPAEK